jgi:hypothetical protein
MNKLRNFKLVLLVRVTKKAKVEKGGGGARRRVQNKKGVTLRHTFWALARALFGPLNDAKL